MKFQKPPGQDENVQKHMGKHVLLIEDSRMFSVVLKHGLETLHGMSVTHCPSLRLLKEAVSRGDKDYALAVLDLNLPDAPNCQALDYVLSKQIAAIVFTGTFNDTTLADILSRQVVDCVVKNQPESIAQVIYTVDRALTNGRTRVMLVGSNETPRATMLDLLRQQRFLVTEARSGADALELIASGLPIDLAITDMTLCDMSAYTFLREVRKHCGEDSLAVIAVGSDPDRLDAARFLQSGGTEFIQVPFLTEEFNSRIFHVANIQQRIQTLQNLAARDYLTDLYNRRHFYKHGPRLVDQCLRRGQGTSIVILDIDHFKRLNDTYGHEIGDLVLKAVAKRLRQHVGERHLLARVGGEEFCILFNGLPLEAAIEFCESLRSDLAKAKVVADDEELSVTVSMGLATIEGKETFENYLNAADQFLYMAKHQGRNKVVSELTLLQSKTS